MRIAEEMHYHFWSFVCITRKGSKLARRQQLLVLNKHVGQPYQGIVQAKGRLYMAYRSFHCYIFFVCFCSNLSASVRSKFCLCRRAHNGCFVLSLLGQVLIYFAVAKKGEAPIDGVTDANPEGLTSACGKWAGEFKERIAKGGLTCHVLPEDKYARCTLVFWWCAVYC